MILCFQCFGIKKQKIVKSLMIQWLGLCFHCQQPMFYPWSGDTPSGVNWKKKKKKMKIEDLPLEMYYFFLFK